MGLAPTTSPGRQVVQRDLRDQQVDPGLVVDAGVEKDVAHQVLGQGRAAEHVRQPPVAAPVVGHRAPSVRDHQPQGGELGELASVIEALRQADAG